MRGGPGYAIATACLVVACSSHAPTAAQKPPDRGTRARTQLPTPVAGSGITPPVSQTTLPNGVAPGTSVVATLTSNGVQRSYRLHAPASSPAGAPPPLVVVLHGANGNAGRVELRYHWDSLSDRDGFFVVYPQGLLDQWNFALDPRAADDVGFLTGVIDHLVLEFSLDPSRVYVAGMSSGAAMAYRLACAMSARIAALASVEGANPGCRPARPVSMVAVHGLADTGVVRQRAAVRRRVARRRRLRGRRSDPADRVCHSHRVGAMRGGHHRRALRRRRCGPRVAGLVAAAAEPRPAQQRPRCDRGDLGLLPPALPVKETALQPERRA